MKEDLLKMADRVEALSGPDREVDERISLAIGLPATVTIGHEVLGNLRQVPHTIKRYTASLDAAMTLVPAGWWVAGLYFCHPDFRSAGDRDWHSELGGPVSWVQFDVVPEPEYECEGGNAATPALALTAAALRALAKDRGHG